MDYDVGKRAFYDDKIGKAIERWDKENARLKRPLDVMSGLKEIKNKDGTSEYVNKTRGLYLIPKADKKHSKTVKTVLTRLRSKGEVNG